MSNSKWSKHWLYDPSAKVPKTTRWRRKLEYERLVQNPDVQFNVDVQEEFSSEVIEGLRSNTSPLKRQKLLDDCLRNNDKEDQLTHNDDFQTYTTVPCYETPMATRKCSDHNVAVYCHESELAEDNHRELVDCNGELINSY